MTYASREEDSVVSVAAVGNDTREASRDGVADPQAFTYDGFQVWKLGGCVDGDVLLLLERFAYLSAQSRHYLSVLGQVIEDPGQRGGCSLGPPNDDEVERRENLIPGHGLEIGIVLHKGSHEVGSVGLHVQPMVDLCVRVFGVSALLLQHALWDELLEKELCGRVVPRSRGERHSLEVAEERAYPGMIIAGLETAEGLSESQVSNDVHGEEIQPIGHVDQGAFLAAILTFGKFSDFADQNIRMSVDQRMLGMKCSFCKGVAQEGTGA